MNSEAIVVISINWIWFAFVIISTNSKRNIFRSERKFMIIYSIIFTLVLSPFLFQ